MTLAPYSEQSLAVNPCGNLFIALCPLSKLDYNLNISLFFFSGPIIHTSVVSRYFCPPLSIPALSNLSFRSTTSIQSIVLAAQMDRGSAFQRQGVSGTERRPAEEEEDEEGEGPWKLNGCRGMKGFVCQQQDIKVSERAGKSWSEGLMSGCERSGSMKCSQRSCCCFNHAITPLIIYLVFFLFFYFKLVLK